MADLSQMLRWNAGFVRSLAQTVLERAKEIRGSLKADVAVTALKAEKTLKRRLTVKTAAPKRTARKGKAPARKTKKG